MTFHVKKLLRFPEFSIDTDIEWNRSVASKKLTNSLQQIQRSISTEQNTSKPNLGQLEYVTRFPLKGM